MRTFLTVAGFASFFSLVVAICMLFKGMTPPVWLWGLTMPWIFAILVVITHAITVRIKKWS